MSDSPQVQPVSLEAKSPFELRVNLGQHVPETDVRTALATGDMGFVHSFTTGSTWMDPECVWWPGSPAASFAASTATIPIPGE